MLNWVSKNRYGRELNSMQVVKWIRNIMYNAEHAHMINTEVMKLNCVSKIGIAKS